MRRSNRARPLPPASGAAIVVERAWCARDEYSRHLVEQDDQRQAAVGCAGPRVELPASGGTSRAPDTDRTAPRGGTVDNGTFHMEPGEALAKRRLIV